MAATANEMKISITVNGQTVELDIEALSAVAEKLKEEKETPAEIREGLFDWHDHIVSAIWYFIFAASTWFEGAMANVVLVIFTATPFLAVVVIHVHKKHRSKVAVIAAFLRAKAKQADHEYAMLTS